jgi:ABC-type nitrate/sulfonate/bicarbonate transport system permease component
MTSASATVTVTAPERAAEARSSPIHRARRLLARPRALRVLSVVVVTAVWEVVGRSDPTYMSYPSAVAQAAWELLVEEDELLAAFRETLWGFTVGYVIAVAIGLAIGFLMGRSQIADVALRPYVNAFYATPRIALIPLLVLFTGIAFQLRVTIVVLSAVFPIIITVRDGARSVAKEYLDVSRCFVATGWQVWKTALLPGSLAFVFAALRMGAQRALIGIIVAETLAALTGTGQLIQDYGQFFQTDRLLVPVIIIGFFSIFMTAGINRLHLWLTPWQRPRPDKADKAARGVRAVRAGRAAKEDAR